ncbi:hypothetical protein BDV98DRAFT_591101 [Pterulicium gracile]|uniref:Uncharacterized protein n=1 Tax=Pterulicium gracile TaxID=1884261 RepID=A0A5C3QSE0_9AGAR|nr:hypothetical protein BDV98DRAFT_591101 [Pterula gracilis]
MEARYNAYKLKSRGFEAKAAVMSASVGTALSEYAESSYKLECFGRALRRDPKPTPYSNKCGTAIYSAYHADRADHYVQDSSGSGYSALILNKVVLGKTFALEDDELARAFDG